MDIIAEIKGCGGEVIAQTDRPGNLKTGMEPQSGIYGGGEIYGERGADELVVRIVGPGIGTGAR